MNNQHSIPGFWGRGEISDFKYFSFAHIIPILFLIILIVLLIKFRNYLKNPKVSKIFCLTLAFLLILSELSYYWRIIYIGGDITYDLPIAVCTWNIIFCSLMILSKNKTLFDISYFNVLVLGLVPLITPAVISDCGPSYFRYYQFWIAHFLPIIAVLYMIFVEGFRPNWWSMLKAFCFLIILSGFAIWANSTIEGANYLFLSNTLTAPSLVDFLPNNLWLKLLIITTLISVGFIIAYVPYIVIDCKSKQKIKRTS